MMSLAGGFSCGSDPGSPVSEEYTGPYPFTGTLYNVVVDTSGELIADHEATMKMVLARQ